MTKRAKTVLAFILISDAGLKTITDDVIVSNPGKN